MRVAIALVALTATAHADFLNHVALRAHVAKLDVSQDTYDSLDTSRLAFSLSALVPGFGTYRLEKRVYGEVRPSGIVGDWILGGAVPLGLAIGALATDDRDARIALGWTAVGLYAVTRLSILVIGNLHISAYRESLAERFR